MRILNKYTKLKTKNPLRNSELIITSKLCQSFELCQSCIGNPQPLALIAAATPQRSLGRRGTSRERLSEE